ncbi:type IV pilin protein [Elusimicrobium minutum]|nr:prepilin-type N-terminal cleavage/methylation domain-containing protein [Elusimicrobium minutum]
MKKAFTLIELLVVVLIIGILAAIALPQYNAAVLKSRTAEAFLNIRALADAQERFFLATGSFAASFDELDITIGSNCSENICLTSQFKYELQVDGNAVAFYLRGGITTETLTLLKRYSTETSKYPVKHNQIACIHRSKPEFIKVCKSLAGAGAIEVSSGFTNGGAFIWS